MAGLKYWVWLSEVKGLTNRSKLLLLDHFGSPENIFYADEDEYRLVEGIEPRQIALLAEKSLEDADRILGACSRLGLRLLTMQDADYPVRLRNIFEPPCLLYVKGQLPVIDEEVAVAMVGTRKASPYGVEAAEKIAYGLSRQGAVVISGAAAGVDSASHRGALRAGGKTIAVLGNGLDVVYPAEHEWLYRDIAASGALISEYPPGTAAEAWHFPVRNRIISGLSLATVVVEAPEKSGALITANTALEQGRDVFAVPGPIDAPMSRGCNRLIARCGGAHHRQLGCAARIRSAVSAQNPWRARGATANARLSGARGTRTRQTGGGGGNTRAAGIESENQRLRTDRRSDGHSARAESGRAASGRPDRKNADPYAPCSFCADDDGA